MDKEIVWIYCGFLITLDVVNPRACFAEYLNRVRALLDKHHAAGISLLDVLLVSKFAISAIYISAVPSSLKHILCLHLKILDIVKDLACLWRFARNDSLINSVVFLVRCVAHDCFQALKLCGHCICNITIKECGFW